MNHKEIIAKVETEVEAAFNEEGFKLYLETQSRFHTYSARNALLIQAQRPGATRVAGYDKWREFNRFVRKGEKAIWITAPMIRKVETAEGKEETVHGFKPVTVFDITQTDGEELPEPPMPTLLNDKEGNPILAEAMVQVAEHLGYTIVVEAIESANGYTDFITHEIHINDGITKLQLCKTLAHELAHALLHEDRGILREIPRGQLEMEAESVAYAVMFAHGMDSSEYSMPYITRWSTVADGKEGFKKALPRIARGIKTLTNMIDERTNQTVDA